MAGRTVVIPVVAGIGNALMAEPMVRQLRAAWPDARIVVTALIPPMAAVFAGIERVETVITGRGGKNLLKSARAVRAMRPDVYLVPFPSNRWQYNVLAKASGAAKVVMHGYPVGRWSALGFLHGNRVPAVRGLHDVVQNLGLLTALGITPDETAAPRFTPTPAEFAAAAESLAAIGLTDRRFAVMHAGSAKTILASAKRWASDRYAELAQRIVAEAGIDVLIVEGPDEAGVSDEILSRTTRRNGLHAIKLTGPLGQSAAVLANAAFYVGTDSGLAHLAAAVDRPAVTLFAPADPDRVCPFDYRHLVVQPPDNRAASFLYPWQATKPKLPADEVGRINTIAVEQVMEKVRIVSLSA